MFPPINKKGKQKYWRKIAEVNTKTAIFTATQKKYYSLATIELYNFLTNWKLLLFFLAEAVYHSTGRNVFLW